MLEEQIIALKRAFFSYYLNVYLNVNLKSNNQQQQITLETPWELWEAVSIQAVADRQVYRSSILPAHHQRFLRMVEMGREMLILLGCGSHPHSSTSKKENHAAKPALLVSLCPASPAPLVGNSGCLSIHFHKLCINKEKHPPLHSYALFMSLPFGNMYVCEQLFFKDEA